MEWTIFVAIIAFYLVWGVLVAYSFNIYVAKTYGLTFEKVGIVAIIIIWGLGLPLFCLFTTIIWINSKTLARIKMYPLTIRRGMISRNTWITQDLNNYIQTSQNNNTEDFFNMAKTLGWKESIKDKNALVKVVSRNERVKLKPYDKEG